MFSALRIKIASFECFCDSIENAMSERDAAATLFRLL